MKYGMFTPEGDKMIQDLVEFASKHNLTFDSINEVLWAIGENSKFQEASDTDVREAVYSALVTSR